MDVHWHESITVDRPVDEVYRYLADFPRPVEWAQTLAEMQLVQPGDAAGIGARYLTVERQAMQADRRPFEPLVRGMKAKTMCEVRELVPDRRIAWHANIVPNIGTFGDLAFELEPAGTGTRLTQRIHFHMPAIPAAIFKLRYGKTLVPRSMAQWSASLRNVKEVVEKRET